MLEDGTGCIEGRKWSESSQATQAQDNEEAGEEHVEGTWVRVVGNLRAFGGKKSLNIYDLRPLEDFNELMYHFASCILSHSYSIKGLYVSTLFLTLIFLKFLYVSAIEV